MAMVAPMTRFWSDMFLVPVLVTAFMLGTSSSYADSCSAIKSQMRSAERIWLLIALQLSAYEE
ncbi:hypothetical protein EOD08_13475, partial [Mesorhizobium sp. M6A.T.Ca.TU.002.02.2.1]